MSSLQGGRPSIITKETLLPLGLAISFIVAALKIGQMSQELSTNSQEIALMRQQTAQINSKVDQIIGRLDKQAAKASISISTIQPYEP